ncbi:hypothetical protein D910_01051, partial [Dendroctonus ponderosae]
MKTYPREERIDMIFTLGECHKNGLLASRVYAQKFPERNHAKPTAFNRFLLQFEETGSVNYKKPITRKSVTEDEENVFALCQELYGYDFKNRTEFCMWVLDKVAENKKFFENVLFSDECTFHNNGLVNRHNFHYYSDLNPRSYSVMKNQNRWSVNVWGGILGQYLIGSYFFVGHLNGLMFLEFLINHLSILLEEVPFNIRINMWLQLDGPPPHYHCEVRQFLNDNFQN